MDKKVLAILLMLAAAALAVAGWMSLPDTVALQLTLTGEAAKEAPKWAALAISFAITVVGAGIYGFGKEEKRKMSFWAAVIGCILGISVVAINLWVL